MKAKLIVLLSIFLFLIISLSSFKSQAQDTSITYHKDEKLYGRVKGVVENEKCLEYKFCIFQKEYYNSTDEYKYNEDGKLVEKISHDYNILGVEYTNYKYDDRGNKIEITTKNDAGISKSINRYDTNNNLIEKMTPLDTFYYKYDDRGNVIEMDGSTFNMQIKIKYNKNNKLDTIYRYYDGKLSSTEKFIYINNKNLYKELVYSDSILIKETICIYQDDSILLEKTIFEYEENRSKELACSNHVLLEKTIYTYRKDSILLEKNVFKYDEEGYEEGYEVLKYDEKSRLIHSENRFKNQSGVYKNTMKYNDRDELIEYTSYYVNNNIGEVEKFKYKYDKKGNWIKREIIDKWGKGIVKRKIKYFQ